MSRSRLSYERNLSVSYVRVNNEHWRRRAQRGASGADEMKENPNIYAAKEVGSRSYVSLRLFHFLRVCVRLTHWLVCSPFSIGVGEKLREVAWVSHEHTILYHSDNDDYFPSEFFRSSASEWEWKEERKSEPGVIVGWQLRDSVHTCRQISNRSFRSLIDWNKQQSQVRRSPPIDSR